MATVKIDKFGGIMPRVHPALLPDGAASEAHNCRLKNGKLVPLKEPATIDNRLHTVYHENALARISWAKSLYCWKHTDSTGDVRTDFLAFPGRVYFAHGNIADDAFDRIFVTGETGITFTTASGNVRKNCPAAYLFDRANNTIVRHCLCKEALATPRCKLQGTLDEDKAVMSAYFFLSWYDAYGYESPATAPSVNANASDGGAIYQDAPLNYNADSVVLFEPVWIPGEAKGVRVYKTNEGDETDNIQLIREFAGGEIANLSNVFSIRMDSAQAQEAMPEIEPPPYDLTDMTFVPGNFYAGRARSMPHTVLFSDIDNPTNWATAYRYDVRDNVVKLAVTSNSVFALTDGTPYALSGTAPESMTVTSLASPAACASEKSVIVYKNAVYFASNQGLFAIYNDADAGTVCQNLTENVFTKEQWQALNPKSCIMGQYDGALHMFFTRENGTKVSYIFEPSAGLMGLTTHDEYTPCLCTDDRTDDMYFVREDPAPVAGDGNSGEGGSETDAQA